MSRDTSADASKNRDGEHLRLATDTPATVTDPERPHPCLSLRMSGLSVVSPEEEMAWAEDCLGYAWVKLDLMVN